MHRVIDYLRVLNDVRVGGWVPCEICTCGVSASQVTVGCAGSIGLAHDELLAGELGHWGLVVTSSVQEGVMLLTSVLTDRLVPVAVVGSTALSGPAQESMSHDIGQMSIDGLALRDVLLEAGVVTLRQVLTLSTTVEDVDAGQTYANTKLKLVLISWTTLSPIPHCNTAAVLTQCLLVV